MPGKSSRLVTMYSRQKEQRKFRIGSWLVDPPRNRLVSATAERKLEPRVMQLLLRLADADGDVVSREALIEDVWEKRVVGDEAIFRAISELRKALDDGTMGRQAIETIRKKGYRLAVPVLWHEESPPPRWRARVIFAVAAVVILGAAAIVLRGWQAGTDSVSAAVSRPLTAFPEREIDPAISVDGQYVAFAWNKSDDYEIYVKEVGSDIAQQVVERPGFEGHVTWSPDGARIAYIAQEADGVSLQVVDVRDGTSRELVKLQAWSFGLDWSPDGSQLALVQPVLQTAMKVVFYSFESGELESARWADDGKREYKPVFSPDGKRLAFIRGDDTGFARVWVADLRTATIAPVTESPMMFRGIDWMPDSERLLLSASMGSDYRLVIVGTETMKAGEAVPGIVGQPFNPSVSSTGRIVYERADLDVNIWRYDIEQQQQRALLVSTRQEKFPDLSPDGLKLVFTSDRSGFQELWMAGSDGSDVVQLTNLEGQPVAMPRFSPDMSKVSFQTQINGSYAMAIYSMTGGYVSYVDLGGKHAIPLRWQDNDSLSVVIRDTQEWNTYVVDLEGRVQKKLGSGFVLNIPAEESISVSNASLTLNKVNQQGIAEELFGPVEPYAWTFQAGRVYFQARENSRLYEYDEASGKLAEIAELPDAVREQFAVSSDGRTIYYSRADRSSNDLYWADL